MSDFEFFVPPELELGVYANAVTAWYSGYDFTLDFAVERPPSVDETHLLAARVRLPASLMFEVIRTLNDKLTEYEREFGDIVPPRRREG